MYVLPHLIRTKSTEPRYCHPHFTDWQGCGKWWSQDSFWQSGSTLHAALLYQNSVSVSPAIDPHIIRDVFFPVSGDIFPSVLSTVEHGIGHLMSREHPNVARSMPFGANLAISISQIGYLSILSTCCFFSPFHPFL